MVIRTEAVQFKADQKLIDFIEKKFSKLEQFFDRITNVTVYMRLENSGQVKDKVVEVKMDVPGDVIFVKETNKTFEESIERISDILKRKLIQYKERRRA